MELSSKTGGAPIKKYKIGDIGEGGGIVFYVSPEGFDVYDGKGSVTRCHYLEMSTINLGESKWGDSVGGTISELGYGKSNTYKMVSGMRKPSVKNSAAYRCIQYKTETSKAGEWFLPNHEEANLMTATQLERLNAETTGKYWVSNIYGWWHGPTNRLFEIRASDRWHSVRAVRAF